MNNNQALDRAYISEMIIDFYRLQAKIDTEILDRFEDFLLVIDSFYIETVKQWNLFKSDDEINLTDLCDLINGYLNFLNEEHLKIFKVDNKLFRIPFLFIDNEIQYMQFLESLNTWNSFEKDIFGIENNIMLIQSLICDEKDFRKDFSLFIDILFLNIHGEMIILIDDLI